MTQTEIQQTLQAAIAHHQAGRLAAAEPLYRRVLALEPNQPDALHLMGVIAGQVGRNDVALTLIRKAIALRPQTADFYGNLGRVLQALGQVDDAISCFRQAIAIRPAYPEALRNLAAVLKRRGQIDEAIRYYTKALSFRPDYFDVLYDLGNTLTETQQFEQAIDCYRKAVALRPDFAEAWNNLANVLKDAGQVDEAIDLYRKALSLRPDSPVTRFNLGIAQLLKGDFENGFAALEARRKIPGLNQYFSPFSKPPWAGEDLAGKTILLHSEEGAGDTLQFVRYVPLVQQRNPAKVIVQCQPELLRLLRSQSQLQDVVPAEQTLPEYDVHCSLLSLPSVFKTTLESIPADIPYLRADPALIEKWKLRVPETPLRIGIASDRPELFNALSQREEVTLINLHRPSIVLVLGERMIDPSKELTDFAEVAALIQNLDLVISTENAIGQLAGAMGKKVLMIVAAASDWRWMLERIDSPWFPSMTLFRQQRPADWQTLAEQIASEVSCLK